MYFLEVLFILAVFSFLITQNILGFDRKYIRAIFWLGWSIFLLSMVLMQGSYRWQMLPAHFVFLILHILLAKRTSSPIFFRCLGVTLGTVMILLAAFLSFALPTIDLPAPNGPYVVGSSTFTLIDETRHNAFFSKPEEQRELGIQVWYPGTLGEDDEIGVEPRLRSLWEEFYRVEGPNWIKFFTSYLKQVKTHSYEDIPISNEHSTYPLVIFSHGIGITAEFNSLLLEHLASHGYIVVAVNHTYISLLVNSSKGDPVYADFSTLNKIAVENRTMQEAINGISDTKKQIALLQQAYQQMNVIPNLLEIGINDLKFVLDEISSMTSSSPRMQEFNEHINTDQIGVMGVSSGGTFITEICRTDNRCLAGINLDGGVISEHLDRPLKVPFLVMSRPFTSNGLGFLLTESKNDYYEIVINDITHGHFTDMTALTPLFRLNPVQEQFPIIMNTTVQTFFDAYLINNIKPNFNFNFDGFSEEITIKTNLP